MKKQTLEYEMDLRSKSDMKRLEAEVRAKAKVDRENQDLYLEQIRLKGNSVIISFNGRDGHKFILN